MQVYNIIIETTRRCNLLCQHCLRGNAQPISMKREYLYSLLRKVDYIGSITFTGGEPSLPSGTAVIEEFIKLARGNVDVGSFYMATNGKRITQPFVDAVRQLFWLCEPDNEVSRVDISNDRWHKEAVGRQAYLPEKLDYLNFELKEDLVGLKFRRSSFQPGAGALLNEGKAAGISGREVEVPDIEWFKNDENEFYINAGELYLNCKGNMINGCNWSYESQDRPENIICHVDNFNEDVIRKIGKEDY